LHPIARQRRHPRVVGAANEAINLKARLEKQKRVASD
jgi:hypothetical protein